MAKKFILAHRLFERLVLILEVCPVTDIVHRVVSWFLLVHGDNAASLKVAQQLGFLAGSFLVQLVDVGARTCLGQAVIVDRLLVPAYAVLHFPNSKVFPSGYKLRTRIVHIAIVDCASKVYFPLRAKLPLRQIVRVCRR